MKEKKNKIIIGAMAVAIIVLLLLYMNKELHPTIIVNKVPVYINHTITLTNTIYVNKTIPIYINHTIYVNHTVYLNSTINKTMINQVATLYIDNYYLNSGQNLSLDIFNHFNTPNGVAIFPIFSGYLPTVRNNGYNNGWSSQFSIMTTNFITIESSVPIQIVLLNGWDCQYSNGGSTNFTIINASAGYTVIKRYSLNPQENMIIGYPYEFTPSQIEKIISTNCAGAGSGISSGVGAIVSPQ